MFYNKLILVAVLMLTATLAQAQPNVPILTVDTLAYLGKTVAGEAGGAFFLPDGNILAVWQGRPIILNSKSGEVIRQLDALPNGFASSPAMTPDETKLVTRVTGPNLAIWDIPSGKIVKQFNYEVGWFCLSPDGTKLYVTEPSNDVNQGIISVYDMKSYERIDRFCKNDFSSGGDIAISPDGQTLAVSVYTPEEVKPGVKRNHVILINLNDKNSYTVLEKLEPSVTSVEFSPDGKHLMYFYDNTMTGTDKHIVIYTIETKEKKYIKSDDLSTIVGFTIAAMGIHSFINSNTILFEVSDLPDNHHIHLSWNFEDNRIKNIINLNYVQSIDIKDSILLLCNQRGVLAYLNKFIVPVVDNKIPNENYITFSNNQLEYYSDKAFVGQSFIYDTTGKLIVNLGSLPFIKGKNIIRVNQTLPIGVYILTIKSDTEQISKKFIVE